MWVLEIIFINDNNKINNNIHLLLRAYIDTIVFMTP